MPELVNYTPVGAFLDFTNDLLKSSKGRDKAQSTVLLPVKRI
jgi:hypothetical protein